MKTKNMIWAALSMTAALVMTACSSDDNMVEAPATPQAEVKTIPYTVTVGQGGDAATTRATVDSDNKTLRFATGDKLYITGENISGVLDIQSGAGETENATFSGDLTYTGEGSPADDLSLTATLVSAQQTVGTEVSVSDAGAVTVNYPTKAYCADVATAVQKYSRLTDTSTYGEKSFDLTQQTAFLNFEITFTDGTASGTALSAAVSNGGSTLCTASVTTTTESEKVVAKFVLPVASSTTLSSAKVTMGTKPALTIKDATLTGKVYNVNRTQAVKIVDLGLPNGTKWASMNVGATSETDYGLFFAWGETTGYSASDGHNFSWANYSLCSSETTMTEYNTTDNKKTLDPADDAATANWGSNWRMPTAGEFTELLNNTNKEWVANYNSTGVAGYKFSNKTDASKYIFLPAAGNRDGTSPGNTNNGLYCSSSLSTSDVGKCQYLFFNLNTAPYVNNGRRCLGFTVRAVFCVVPESGEEISGVDED